MNTWEAILLGIIQGATEFFPVSSSGHLELAQLFLGFKDLHKYVLFDLVCHLGTLCAILYLLYPTIVETLKTNRTRFYQICLATLPLFPLVFILKPIKALFNEPQFLGFGFLLTSLLLFAGIYAAQRQKRAGTWGGALTIGCVQAVAILPGVSRSGSTISAARLLGWQKDEAFTFSFLMAIPAILGGVCLEILQALRAPHQENASINTVQFFAAFITSFGVGYLALKLLKRLLDNDRWIYFAWYCLILGIATTYYFNFIG